MKSKYPNQIDTASELPVVRDNITEITSDVINSLRSAIIQIEKTLGVNPQGVIGQTLSDRISSVIDNAGNLKLEAIDRAGIISGPIFDDQISEVAAIKESKLKLNYPTQVLQSEISFVSSLIDEIQSQIEQISATLSAHINAASTNRHLAKAITITGITKATSAVGIKTFEAAGLQDTLESLVTKHFNYTGDSITSDNNSHSAEQIYFDNSVTLSAIESSSVQGAIEEIASGNAAIVKKNLSYLTKNGFARYGDVYDAYSSDTAEETLISATSISFSSSSSTTSLITFDTVPIFAKDIVKFDILTISGATTDLDNKSFYISEVTTNGGSGLVEILVYGKLYGSSLGTAIGKITKNNFKTLNPNGLNTAVRLRDGFSNTPDIIVANPNSANITTFGLRPDLVSSTASSFKIQVDDYDAITVSVYNSTLPGKQSIDSIVDKTNESFVLNHMAVFAYKIRTTAGYEMSISHAIPNFSGDIKNRTIKITAADSNDASDTLGFSHIIDQKIQGSFGNATFINGSLFRDFQKAITFSKSEVSFGSGSAKLISSGDSFLDSDIRSGDLVVVTGSTETSDDGLFSVLSVAEDTMTLDAPSGFTFDGNLSETSSVLVFRSSAPISELNFEEIDESSGLMLVDIFATQDSDIFFSKRLEISNVLYSVGFFASIIDISKNFMSIDETFYLKVTSAGMAYLEDSLGATGEQIYVANSLSSFENNNIYKIKSPDGGSYVTIKAVATANPTTNLSCTIYGNYEVSQDSLWLSRCLFSNGLGRIFGSTGVGGIPSVIDKRNFGSIDIDQICPAFVEKYIEGPRNEMRSSGIISGCQASISSTGTDAVGDYLLIDVSPGIYIASGIRKEFLGITGYKTYNIELSYLCLNEYGVLEILLSISGGPISQYVSPFLQRGAAHIGYLTDGSVLKDLRFFVSDLDRKLTYNIIVAKSTSLGHFTDIQSAVDYCSLFYNINYGKSVSSPIYCPSILIREGEYTINSPIIINEDITISGVGRATVLKRGPDISDCARLFDLSAKVVPDPLTAIFIIGDGPSTGKATDFYTSFDTGVTIKNLSYYSASLTTNSSTCFCLLQGNDSDSYASFVFKDIFATGAPERSSDNTIKEYFIFAGRINTSTGVEIPGNNSLIFITSNHLKRMGAYHSGYGSENIAVEFSNQLGTPLASTLTVKDIICMGNMCLEVAPGAAAESASILRSSFSAAQYATVGSIIEASNIVRTVS